ncbi:MAG: helix-turn-helix domain-containing protein [Candidatus Rokuibacteriota bacterium]
MNEPAAAETVERLVCRLNDPAQDPAYFLAEEVAALLRTSQKSVYRIRKADPTMPALVLGKSVRFPSGKLRRWLASREQGAGRARRTAP